MYYFKKINYFFTSVIKTKFIWFLGIFMCCFASGFGQTITIADVSQDEDSGAITLTATLDIATLGGFTVDVSTNDGSATLADNDYTAIVSQVLTFIGTAGESQTFNVIPTLDTTVEADETLTVTMDNLVGLVLVNITDTAIVTITNDDSDAISISSVAQVEGDTGTSNFVFTISVDGGDNTLNAIDFTINTADVTATAGSDYVAIAGGSGTIAAGTPSTTVTVVVNGDTAVEPDEGFTVNLTAPINATITDGIGVGTITNDDSDAISINDVTQVEGDTGTSNFVFTISVDGGGNAANAIDFTINTADGTATTGTDYVAIAGGSGTIAAGTPSTTVTVVVNGDTAVEPEEGFTVNLTVPINATITDGIGAGTITNDDSATVSINDPTPVLEGDTLTATLNFAVSIDQSDPTTAITLDYTVSGGNENGTTLPLTFAAGATGAALIQTVSVTTNGDTAIEPDEVIAITLGNPSANATISVIDGIGTSSFLNDDVCAGGTTAPPINGDPTSFCDTNSVNLNDFVVGGTGSAPPNSTLEWSTIPNPTSDLDLISTSVVTTSDIFFAVYWDGLNDCASPSSEVNIIFNSTPNIDADDVTTACSNSATVFGATTVNLDDFSTGSDAGNWVFTSGPTNIVPDGSNVVQFSNQADGTYIYTYTTNTAVAPCVDQSFMVTITVADCDPCIAGNIAPDLNTTIPTVFCDAINVSLNDYTNSTPPAGTTLEWTTVSDPESPTAIFLMPTQINNPNPGTVFGFFWDAVNSCASPTLEITIVLSMTPVITATTGNSNCGPSSLELTVAGNIPGAAQPPTFNWYASDDPTDMVILASGTTFSTPGISTTTTYFVEATANDCTSARVPVIATISPLQSAGTPSNTSSCSNIDNGPTTVDLDDRLMGESTGVWTITSDPSGTLTIDTGNIVNFVNRPDGDYVFTFTTTLAEAPCVNESSEVTITVNDCDMDTDLDGIFDGSEAILGTDPNNPDTDGDGINDGDEVGIDILNPIDTDGDAIIDALESNILDEDMDGVVDQLDPANNNPCIPDNTNDLCDTDGDGITDGDELAGPDGDPNTTDDNSDPLDACDPNLTSDCMPDPIDLEIAKTVDNENAVVGEIVVFTITVTNLSDSRVLGVKISDILESGFEYVEHIASIGTYDNQTGDWDIFEIEPLQAGTLEITVEILPEGIYTNIAELVESFPIDITTENNSSDIVTINIDIPEGVDLVIEKTAFSPTPLVNDEVVFTIKVTNESVEDLVSQIEVSDVLDTNGFEYINDSATIGEYNEDTGVWMIPSLDVDQEAILTITVVVPNEGNYTNTATITRSSPTDDPENNSSTIEVNVSLPTPAEVGIIFNQFSPNGDGINDILKINRRDSETNQDVEIIDYNISIFNRYGNLIFEVQNRTESEVWDGTYKGNEAPNGTYFYILNIDIGNGTEVKKGWIQLIR